MKLPFVSRERFEQAESERQRFLNIILENGLTEALAEPVVTEIQPEQFNQAREEVKEQAKATYQAFISRRPSAIVADQNRRKQQEYIKKYQPNTNAAAAMFEAAEREAKGAQA